MSRNLVEVALDLTRAVKYNRIKDGWLESSCQVLLTTTSEAMGKLVTTTRIVKSILPIHTKG